jgi:ribonuclease HI
MPGEVEHITLQLDPGETLASRGITVESCEGDKGGWEVTAASAKGSSVLGGARLVSIQGDASPSTAGGAFSFEQDRYATIASGRARAWNCDSFTTEQLGVDEGLANSVPKKKLLLRTDGQAVLSSLKSPGFRDERERSIAKRICSLADGGVHVTLAYVAGHGNCAGNEKADRVATSALAAGDEGVRNSDRNWPGDLADSALKAAARNTVCAKLNECSRSTVRFLGRVTGGKFGRSPTTSGSGKVSRAKGTTDPGAIPRWMEGMINQCRVNCFTGCADFAARIGKAPSAVCPRCLDGNETVEHILLECQAIGDQRDALRKSIAHASADSKCELQRGGVLDVSILENFPAQTAWFLAGAGYEPWLHGEITRAKDVTEACDGRVDNLNLDGRADWTLRDGNIALGNDFAPVEWSVDGARSVSIVCCGKTYSLLQDGSLCLKERGRPAGNAKSNRHRRILATKDGNWALLNRAQRFIAAFEQRTNPGLYLPSAAPQTGATAFQ